MLRLKYCNINSLFATPVPGFDIVHFLFCPSKKLFKVEKNEIAETKMILK